MAADPSHLPRPGEPASPSDHAVGATSAESSGALDILEDLEAERFLPGPMCVAARMRRERPDLYEQWRRVIPLSGDPRFSARRVSDWFLARGYSVSGQQVEHHRAGGCVRCRTTSSPS